MKGCEPCQKPQKTPPARKPIAKQDNAGPGGQLIADRYRPRQGRGQQDEGGRRPDQRPAYDPPARCAHAAQQARRQQKERGRKKVDQQKNIEIDHGPDKPRPLLGDYSRRRTKNLQETGELSAKQTERFIPNASPFGRAGAYRLKAFS